jgi:group II intron reverse transcriptase/maturase
MNETQGLEIISTKLDRIATLAARTRGQSLTTLAHHIDLAWLREAYRRTRKDGARGVDGQGAEEYAVNLEGNLQSLLDRAKSGTYRAPPVRRVYIPKVTGEMRPLGIPTFEDKVLQRAVTMVLEAVYEQEFFDCSYGFRRGRSAHQALDAFHGEAMRMGGGWVVELDIRKYFDSIGHERLRKVLHRRVRDGVILRLIGKWLNAGVMEDGARSVRDSGTPQGGVISPMLANIFLHEVLDVWFTEEVRPRLRGRASLVRFADDAVMLFQHEEDAHRMMAVLPKRFGRYGLELHPDKTRILPFRRPGGGAVGGPGGLDKPSTFNFLGFTIHWGKTLSGKWAVKLRTAADRFRRALRSVSEWCRRNRHAPLETQQKALAQKLRGHYGYFNRIGNRRKVWDFLYRVVCEWWRWLRRRSQRGLPPAALPRIQRRFPLPKPSPLRVT